MHPAELLARYDGHSEANGLFCARTGFVPFAVVAGAVAAPLLAEPVTGKVRAFMADKFQNGGQAAMNASEAYRETSDDAGISFFAKGANRLNAAVYGRIGGAAIRASNLLNPYSKTN